MLDLLATRFLPFIIIIALALIAIWRLVEWVIRIRKGRDGNPPRDSGYSE